MNSGIKSLLFINAVLWTTGCGSPMVEVNGDFMTKDEALRRGYLPSPEQVRNRTELANARLKPTDVVFVTVRVDPSLTHSYTITSAGEIDLGYAGRIVVTGLTEREAATRIRKHLENTLFNETDVNVEIREHNQPAHATGVPAPGR